MSFQTSCSQTRSHANLAGRGIDVPKSQWNNVWKQCSKCCWYLSRSVRRAGGLGLTICWRKIIETIWGEGQDEKPPLSSSRKNASTLTPQHPPLCVPSFWPSLSPWTKHLHIPRCTVWLKTTTSLIENTTEAGAGDPGLTAVVPNALRRAGGRATGGDHPKPNPFC